MKISCGIWPACQPPQNEVQQVFSCIPFNLVRVLTVRTEAEVKL